MSVEYIKAPLRQARCEAAGCLNQATHTLELKGIGLLSAAWYCEVHVDERVAYCNKKLAEFVSPDLAREL